MTQTTIEEHDVLVVRTNSLQLAADCAQDGQHDVLHVAAPAEVATGSGSPGNPVVTA